MHAAFDSDAVIYAAIAEHPLGVRVARILAADDGARTGSLLLLPEILSKPTRDAVPDIRRLDELLGLIHLRPVDRPTALLAVDLGAQYRLRAADAIHLATAVAAGADTFITNNRKDFPTTIEEIDVVYPDELPAP